MERARDANHIDDTERRPLLAQERVLSQAIEDHYNSIDVQHSINGLDRHPIVAPYDRDLTAHASKYTNANITTAASESHLSTLRALPHSVYLIYFLSFMNMFLVQAIQPVLVLYLDFQGWTSADDARYYSYLTAISALAPVPFNLLLGMWTARGGAREVLFFGTVIAVFGFMGLTVFTNKIGFAFAFGLVYILEAIRRTVHQSYIARYFNFTIRGTRRQNFLWRMQREGWYPSFLRECVLKQGKLVWIFDSL